MNPKIKLLAFAFLLAFTGLNAQKNNIQNAINGLKFNELDKAKKAIDLAAEHQETRNDSKMWLYRGKVYLAILDDKEKKFPNLDPDAAEKAFISFINCKKTDVKEYYKDQLTGYIISSTIKLYNAGIQAHNDKDYEKAIRFYNHIYSAFEYDKEKSLQRNNITADQLTDDLYLSAIASGDKTKAKEYLQKLIDVSYKKPSIYIDMSRLLLEEKDTAKALSYIEKGRDLFYDDQKLIDAEVFVYTQQGKTDVLIEKIAVALEASPDNEVLNCLQGTLFEKKDMKEKAEIAYKKAIEINPDYFVGNYQLGALYFNSGVEWNAKANALSLNETKKLDEYNANAEKDFKNSLPYLEKAMALNENDLTVLRTLKQLYVRTGETEKAQQITDKLKQK